ncbi:MAG: penicillin-binding [Bacteroidetes bacterium]|nr:MAG: penicillin-binding [Bacteroidota bacterium]
MHFQMHISKRFKTVLFIVVSVIAFVLFAGFLSRNRVLNHLLNARITAIENSTGVSVDFEKARFSGISSIIIQKISINPPAGDTLMTVNRIRISINPLALLTMKLKFGYAEIDHPVITLRRQGIESNYLFLLENQSDSTIQVVTDSTETNYKLRIDRLFGLAFNYIPESIRIKNAEADAHINQYHLSVKMNDLLIDDHEFISRIEVTEDSLISHWKVGGIINSGERTVGLKVSGIHNEGVRLPFIQEKWGLLFAFDSLSINLSYKQLSDSISQLKGSVRTWNQVINHVRISPEDVNLSIAASDFSVNFGQTWAEIDSATSITYNRQTFRLFARYDNSPKERFRIRIHEPDFDASDFFGSLPAGLFTNLAGIKVKGKLGFTLNFDYETEIPDSLLFNAALTSKGFSVLQYGATNFTYINNDFVYTAYEKGRAVRTFIVGQENPNFRRLDQIPLHLQRAIMTSEDGAFFHHNGFLPDAIRESIITNIKEKRFARGGSTISMQLVKNVFLTRNKTITRKVEEMLITWLIESQRMVSKDRMFEVYLNVIETGTMVYGVNEAAKFYFNKDVSKLTLAECIYIASIVPKPKWFRYSFDENGELREHLIGYYSLVSSKMLRKEWITQEESDQLQPRVELKGPARNQVVPDEPMPEFDEDEGI